MAYSNKNAIGFFELKFIKNRNNYKGRQVAVATARTPSLQQVFFSNTRRVLPSDSNFEIFASESEKRDGRAMKAWGHLGERVLVQCSFYAEFSVILSLVV